MNNTDRLNENLNKIGILLVEEESKYNEMFDYMFKDLAKICSFKTVVEKTFFHHWRLKRFFRTKNGKKIFNIIAKVVSAFLRMPKEIKDYSIKYNKTIVIMPNSSMDFSFITLELLQNLKNKYPSIIWVLFYVDSISFDTSTRANEIREAGFFDIVYTMDDADAERYSLIKFNTPYSKDKEICNVQKNTDLFFCGIGKNREKLIENIDDSAKINNVDFKVYLPWYTSNTRTTFNIKYLPYNETIIKSLEANCILEIVADYQHGLTLRPYEAACYNRKLLTNNKAIFDFKYYNPKYIHYFEKTEDIDWEWVKKKENVEYGYKGEYSPIFLVIDILSRMNN